MYTCLIFDESEKENSSTRTKTDLILQFILLNKNSLI